VGLWGRRFQISEGAGIEVPADREERKAMLVTALSALLVVLFLVMVGGIEVGLIFLCLIVASVVLIFNSVRYRER
jgi:Flp pilus assembly protein TadB